MHHRMLRLGCAIAIIAALTLNLALPGARGVVYAQDIEDKDRPDVRPLAATAGSTVFALAVAPGLGAQPQRLISFDVSAPGSLQGDVRISGLPPGEVLKGIDFRPATGELFALGGTSRLYVIDPFTGVATATAAPFTPVVDATSFFGFDFNPVPDRIRAIAGTNDQNLRLNPNTGAVATADPNVAYATGDPSVGQLPNIVAEAYSNNVAGVTSTTNFAIDARPDGPARLVLVGTRDFPNSPPGGGTAVSPNTGQLFTVGNLRTAAGEMLRSNNFIGFDIFETSATGFVSLTPENPFNSTSTLYTVDLSNGVVTAVGPVGGNVRVDSLTVAVRSMTRATVQLSAASYTVAEGAGSLTITIERVATTPPDTTQPITLEFQTDDMGEGIRCDVINGLATPRCDYSTASRRITFASGETSQTVTIFIVDDGFAEGSETFTVSLRDVSTGSQIGSTGGRATVTITDNETTNAATNPIDTPEFFVRQLYRDFLTRDPEPAGLAAWLAVLNGCPAGNTSCDRVFVASAFSRADEYLNKGYFAIRFYRAALGRRPTYQEFIRDSQRLTATTPEAAAANRAAFAEEFTIRDEFRARYGSLDNGQFINLLYSVAGITLTSAQRDQILFNLNNNVMSRGMVLRALTERQDFSNREFNAGFVLSQYFGFLRRDPDEAGFQNFLALLNSNPNDPRAVVANFVNSTEYRLRFGRP